MTKITRPDLNVQSFASEAKANERTVFGDTSASDDLTKNLSALFMRGWGYLGASDLPSYQDFNAAMFTMSQLTAYLFQTGIAEWNSNQEYHINSMTNYNGGLYVSLQNSNTNKNPATATTYWKVIIKDGLYLPVAGGTISGNLNVTGNLQKSGSNVLTVAGGTVTGNTNFTGTLTKNGKNVLTEGDLVDSAGTIIAWGRFDYSTNKIVEVKAGAGIESITRTSTGKYLVKLSKKITNANYTVLSNAQEDARTDNTFCAASSPMNLKEAEFEIWVGDNNTDEFKDTSNCYFSVISL